MINIIIFNVGSIFDNSQFLSDIKNRKIFVKRDIFVYAFLLILLLSSFLTMIFSNQANSLGFKVEINGKTILTHAYGQDFSVIDEYNDLIVIDGGGDNFTVKILCDEGFNLLLVDEMNKTVKMQESDCPSKNCVHMQAISNTGAIYCAPRELKVTPLTDNEFVPPTTGGVS